MMQTVLPCYVNDVDSFDQILSDSTYKLGEHKIKGKDSPWFDYYYYLLLLF